MRTRPHTTARLYRWVRPKRNPMANAIDETRPEEEDEDDEDEEEEGESGADTCLDSWETENALVFELHGFDDHEEIIVFEEEEVTPGKKDVDDRSVALALSLEDLDEAIDVLKEIRVKMVERQQARARPAAAARTTKPKS